MTVSSNDEIERSESHDQPGQVNTARSTPGRTRTNLDIAQTLAPGTVVAGRYRIIALAGIGGMGVVYKARDDELNLDVALKALRSDLAGDPRFLERFRRELILARQVSHPNVVRIHDIGDDEGLRFLTMGYVEGQSLFEVLERGGPLPVERAVAIVRQLADALEHAHGAGIVHRDLKPGNILLGAGDTAYITDFGVARAAGHDGLTRAGAVVGTPDYLSPEQVTGDPVDGRSDIYALGIVFYEMLTGRLPFAGDSHEEILAQRLTGRIRDIRQTGTRVPRWVSAAIARCLERQPSRRYQHARELSADLDRRSARWLGLPRLQAAALAAVVIAALVGWSVTQPGGLPFELTAVRSEPPKTEAGKPANIARHAVAVLPLADDTADPALAWTGSGVSEMLSASLSQSPDLRVLDAQRVLGVVRDLGLADARFDERTISQLADLLDVDTLLAGSVRRAGSALRVDLRVITTGANGNNTRHMGSEAAGDAGLFGLIPQLADQLRRELGAERPISADPHETGTTSMAAAKAYFEGRSRLALGDHVGAAPAFNRAVEADPTFVLALDRLSETYQNLGYHEKALDVAERAARALEGNESRASFRVQSRLALLRGQPEEAEKRYTELARRYPYDTEVMLDLANAQTGRGDIARAVETLKKATANDQNDPRAWFLLGKNTILTGDSRRAVNDYLIRALALQNQFRNEQGQADALNAMGVAHHQLGDYAQALEKYTSAAQIRQRLGDERGTATTLKNRARVLLAMSRSGEAAPDLLAARQIYERIGDRSGLADVMNDFGVLHERRGAYTQALTQYQAALKIRRDLGDERLLAQSYDNVGYIYFVGGEYDNAGVYWKESLSLREKNGEKGGTILSMQNLGFLQTAKGRWTEALKLFLDALERSREIDFKNAMAVSFGNVGILQHYQGRFTAALGSFDEALKILEQLKDKRGLAEFTLKQAAVLLDLGRVDEAKARLDQVESWVQETKDQEQLSDYFVLSGEWAAARGDREAAQRAFKRATEHATASRSRPAILRARIAEGAGTEALGNPVAAGTLLVAAVQTAESLGNALLRIRATEALARTHLARRQLREAERQSRSAISLAERHGWDAGLFRLHLLLGAILERRGDVLQAAAEYRDAAAQLAKVREGLPATFRAGFDALPPVRQIDDWMTRQARVARATSPNW